VPRQAGLALPLLSALLLLAAALLAPAPARAADPPKSQATGAPPPEDIVVTARRRNMDDLQTTQEFNAAELARLRREFEPPPARVPRGFESTDIGAGRSNSMSAISRTRGMIEDSPHVGDLIQ
jgi:hypothetical protein